MILALGILAAGTLERIIGACEWAFGCETIVAFVRDGQLIGWGCRCVVECVSCI